MQDTTSHKRKLGLFVFIGLLFFFALIFLIGKQQNLFTKQIDITTSFKNASGLKVGNMVRFSGISVGTIANIEIVNDTTVKVDMKIKKEIQKFIKLDSKASIGSAGVIGDKILVISQGTVNGKNIKNGQYISSSEPIEFDEIISSVKVTAENAEVISSELAGMLININEGKGSLGKLIKDESMAKNLDKTMTNIEQSTKKLDENMEAAKHNFLLRGYFKKKEKAAAKAKEEAEKKAAEAKKAAQKK